MITYWPLGSVSCGIDSEQNLSHLTLHVHGTGCFIVDTEFYYTFAVCSSHPPMYVNPYRYALLSFTRVSSKQGQFLLDWLGRT